MKEKLTVYEAEALLKFLKKYVNRDNLSIFDNPTSRHLLLAFVKLQNCIDEWEAGKAYTE